MGLHGGVDSTARYSTRGNLLVQHHALTIVLVPTGAAQPSNTSRYVSADVGLIHLVGLDLNNLDAAQLAWLDQDLMHAHANRFVPKHYPLPIVRLHACACSNAAPTETRSHGSW